MSEFKPSQKSAQVVANKIAGAAETAGARMVTQLANPPTSGVHFTNEAWQQFVALLLQDVFRPKP